MIEPTVKTKFEKNKHKVSFKALETLEKPCSVKGCFNKYYAKGYCSKHYANFIRHGFPEKPFCSRKIDFQIDENGCYNCTSHNLNKDGYPTFRIRHKSWLLNRFIYTEMFGEIPKGLVVRHKCDNPACINPEHLELGTIQDNVQDMIDRNRQVKGSKCHLAILDEKQVKEIKLLIIEGKRNVDIAKKFGVNERIISNIKHKKRWAHVEAN